MKGRTVFSAVFSLFGLAAGWMAWLTERAGEGGQWLFGVFATFFLVLAAALFLPASKKKPTEVRGTRFVPAWQMEGMILLTVLLLVLALVAHCFHPVK
jgi:hypothetical protein